MVNKSNSKHKALKKTANKTGFFRALIFGFVISVITWLILAVVISFVVSKQSDGNMLLKILSPLAVLISLGIGGYAAGKIDKTCAFLSSVSIGGVMTGICYVVSVFLEMSKDSGSMPRGVYIALMFLSPVIGARFSVKRKTTGRHGKRKM